MNQRAKLLTGTIIIGMSLVIGMVIFAGLPIHAAGQAVFVVNELGDSGDGTCSDETCTLRDAILEANATEGIDTITFDLADNSTIVLDGSQLPVITDSLFLLGSGANDLAISAGNASRIFSIDSGVNAYIQDLTLRDGDNRGDNGGAILNSGSLLLQSTRIMSSTADYGAAIYSEGASLTVVSSQLLDNHAEYFGGAVDLGSSGNVTITDSIIRDNTSLSNGGAFHQLGGTLTVLASTVQGNSGSIGGGFSNGGGTLVVRNSTIYSNTSSTWGGGFYIDATSVVTISNSTISDNAAEPSQGGGLYSDSTNPELYLSNVIIANSVGGDCFAENDALVSNTSNLVEDGGCNATSSGDPLLTDLGWYGGDTKTMMPYPGSPAIDQGDSSSCESVDQRGTARPIDGDGTGGAVCDIGAVEAPFNPTITVNQITDNDDGVCDLSHCTLREAINASKVAAGVQTIGFDLPNQSTITLSGSQLPVITDSLLIDGMNAVSLTVSGGNTSRIFEIGSGNAVTITGMTLADGNTSGGSGCPSYCGGAILNNGLLSLENVIFEDNSSWYGGAVYDGIGSSLNLRYSHISNNSADFGGAIYHFSSDYLRVFSSTFESNSATSGGGFYLLAGTVEIVSGDLYSNTAGWGGGVYNNGSKMLVDKSRFAKNSASNLGGAIRNRVGKATVVDSNIIQNSASAGGGLYSEDRVTMTRSTVSENDASSWGGGIYIRSEGVLTMTNSTVSANSSGDRGGGLANSGNSLINNSTFSNNSADGTGGGLYIYSTGEIDITNSIIANSPSGLDCVTIGTFSNNHRNLVSDGSCNPDFSGDPYLGTLADNGGSTLTQAIEIASPAFNNGDDSTCEETDQRGIPRPQDAACDIGAFELEVEFNLFLPLIIK